MDNTSFEGGTWRQTHTGQQFGEITVPKKWVAFWHPDYKRPEMKVVQKSLDPVRVHDGNQAFLSFTFHSKQFAGLYQEVNVTPGSNYRLTCHAHAWSAHTGELDPGGPHCSTGVGCEAYYLPSENVPPLNGDPFNDAIGNFTFYVGVGVGTPDPFSPEIQWSPGDVIYNAHHELRPVVFTAHTDKVVVYLKAVSIWDYKHSDAYWDMVVLEETSSPPNYKSTMLVLPQDATQGQLAEILEKAYPQRRTFGFSHDDAGHLNGTAILYNIKEAEKFAYLDFYAQNYPNVTIEFAYTSDFTPEEEAILWQCEPAYANNKFGGVACDSTICKDGCFITDVAGAQRLMGIDRDATPVSVDAALGQEGYNGCRARWDAIEEKCGITISQDGDLDAHLDSGGLALLEVQPSSLEHFVLCVGKEYGDYIVHDTWKNKKAALSTLYPGFESYRLLSKFQGSNPLLRLGLHLQTNVDGVEDYLRCNPTAIKVFSPQDTEWIKAINPNVLTVVRFYRENQDISGGQYVAEMLPDLRRYEGTIDYVESFNETIGSNMPDEIRRWVGKDVDFANALRDTGLDIKPLLLNVPVGNPLEEEVVLLLPAVRAAVRAHGALGYHAYWERDNLETKWIWHAGRWQEWDKVFVSEGLYPDYIFTEIGVVDYGLNAYSGWRNFYTLDRYLDDLFVFNGKLHTWNLTHNARAKCGTIFTTGIGTGWESFQVYSQEMQAICARYSL